MHFFFTKKLAITYHFLLTELRPRFLLILSNVNLKSLLVNHSCTDHPCHVLFPIICASNVDPMTSLSTVSCQNILKNNGILPAFPI